MLLHNKGMVKIDLPRIFNSKRVMSAVPKHLSGPPPIIESVDSISKDERGFPLTQYITNGRISGGGYTFTDFKHYHRVLRLISYRMGV